MHADSERFLEEAEEGFHRGIVFAGGDPAHGSKQLMSGQHLTELLGSELAGPVGVDDAGGDLPPRIVTACSSAPTASRDLRRADMD